MLRPLLQDEPELQPDEGGLVARALGGPVLGAGGAQEEQGRTLQVCLSTSPNTHSTHVFHFSLCQRYCEQVRLVHLTVLAVPVSQIREQIVDVIKVIPEEWMSKRIVQQIVDVPVPQILEEIVALVAGEVVCNARSGVRRQHGWTCTCREADRGWSGTTDPGEDC